MDGTAMADLMLPGRPWVLARRGRDGEGEGEGERGAWLGAMGEAVGGELSPWLLCSVCSLTARVRKKTAGRKEKRRERKEKKKGTKKEKEKNGKFFQTWKFSERKIKDN
jgi:hypothetical protein